MSNALGKERISLAVKHGSTWRFGRGVTDSTIPSDILSKSCNEHRNIPICKPVHKLVVNKIFAASIRDELQFVSGSLFIKCTSFHSIFNKQAPDPCT